MPKFLIVIKGNNVRDAQYCIENNADVMDDEKWRDAEDCELVSGVVETPTEADAIAKQASVEGVEKEVLKAYKLVD